MFAAICMVAAVFIAAASPQRDRLTRLNVVRSPHEYATARVSSAVRARAALLWSRRGRRDRTQQAVIDVADAWASELQAGRAPTPALALALEQGPEPFSTAGDQIRLGGDPTVALLSLSCLPGAQGLRSLAACWTLAATAGAGLADPVSRVALGLRDARSVEQELAAQVAAPKATARLVASLPIAGPLLGAVIGADTVEVLLSTPAGRACLVLGLGLNLAGLWWVRRIIASVGSG